MKRIKLILIIFLMAGIWSSCYTKKQAVKKFCRQDSVSAEILVHDTFWTKTVQTDTVVSLKVDSFTLIKDNLIIRYRKVFDSIFIQGECTGDTIYREKLVQVMVPITTPGASAIEFNEWLNSQPLHTRLGFYLIFLLALIALLSVIWHRVMKWASR